MTMEELQLFKSKIVVVKPGAVLKYETLTAIWTNTNL